MVAASDTFILFVPKLPSSSWSRIAMSCEPTVQGYFQAPSACIERLPSSLKVMPFVLPATDEAVLIWTQRFRFGNITQNEVGAASL